MNSNPNLYEINTRVWLRRFDSEYQKAKLDDVPLSYWDELKEKGIDIIWLMGVWKNCESTIEKYCFEDGLVREYKAALKDYSKEDVIGSPFSIDEYMVNPIIGNEESLLKLKSELNKRGMKLMLDFVHNHFSADSTLLKERPEIFLESNENYYTGDTHTYFKPDFFEDRFFAHGRDPFYPAWKDTVQVNFFSKAAREYMIKILVKLTKLCDGVRCDMAMLALNNVFKNTWGNVLESMGFTKPEKEFWAIALEIVKDLRNDFIFLAEAYWDLEWELQQLGFDYTYDKSLTDRLKSGFVHDIKDHLLAEMDYQNKSARFIENHDEERAVKSFGVNQSKAAAVIISTLPGMHFYNDGQFEGKQIKLPVQLKREPDEKANKCLLEFYDNLLQLTSHEVFKKGQWNLLTTFEAAEGSESHHNILAWEWKYGGEKRLMIINYSDKISHCRLHIAVGGYPEEILIEDLLSNKKYYRSSADIIKNGLFIELQGYRSHIFRY
jgi:hypothetical protein